MAVFVYYPRSGSGGSSSTSSTSANVLLQNQILNVQAQVVAASSNNVRLLNGISGVVNISAGPNIFIWQQGNTISISAGGSNSGPVDLSNYTTFPDVANLTGSLQAQTTNLQQQISQQAGAVHVVFREQFVGDGSSSTFQLSGAVTNAQFISGGWIAPNILTTLESDVTNLSNKPLYDAGVLSLFTRHRIGVDSISVGGLVSLDYIPQNLEPFYVWYWYNLATTDRIENYYRDDYVAKMEQADGDLATNIKVNTVNFDGALTSSEDTAQKAFEKLDDIVVTDSALATISASQFNFTTSIQTQLVDLSGNTVRSVNSLIGTLTISAGPNIVVWQEGTTIAISAGTAQAPVDLSNYATLPDVANLTGNLQTQIDNLDLNYATDAAVAATSAHLQSEIENIQSQVVEASSNNVRLLNGISGVVNISADANINIWTDGNTIAISASVFYPELSNYATLPDVAATSATLQDQITNVQSQVVAASSSLQTQVDNLDLTYATDASVAATSAYLQSEIENIQTQVVEASSNNVRLLNGLSGVVNISADANINVWTDGNTIAISASNYYPDLSSYATLSEVSNVSAYLQNEIDTITSTSITESEVASISAFLQSEIENVQSQVVEASSNNVRLLNGISGIVNISAGPNTYIWAEGNTIAISAGKSRPAGNNLEIQFNDNGEFGSSGNLYYDPDDLALSVENSVIRGGNGSVSDPTYTFANNGSVGIYYDLDFFPNPHVAVAIDSEKTLTIGNDLTYLNTENFTVSGDATIGGKLTVVGLIDPTGLALTPVPANPGISLSGSTLWANSSDSNNIYFGSLPLASVPLVASISAYLQSEIDAVTFGNITSSEVAAISAYLQSEIDNLDNTYATDASVAALSAQLQPYDNDLTALANISGTGIVVRTGFGTATTRSLSGEIGRITLTNADGVLANPIIDLSASGVIPGTYTKVSVDQFGRSTFGDYINTSDITGALGYVPIDDTNVVHKTGYEEINGDKTFFGNVVIGGNLYIGGTQTIVNTEGVSAKDNIIYINAGEVGPGVTSLSAGIQVDRGTVPDYFFIFDEVDDVFKIGEENALQPVATREDIPLNNGYARWNSSLSRFDTVSSSFVASDISGALSAIYQPYDVDLSAVAGLSTTGYIVRTGLGTAVTRQILGSIGRIEVTNSDGISSNTTIDLSASGVIPGTYTKVEVDQFGRVVEGLSLTAQDITGALGYIPNGTVTNTFLSLTDTPDSYVNQNGNTVIVSGSQLIFMPLVVGIINLNSIDSAYTVENDKITTESIPHVTLIPPISGSSIYTAIATNIMDGSFVIELSDIPSAEGYRASYIVYGFGT